MNIIWQQPSGQIAVTSIFGDENPENYATELQFRGDVPTDWVPVAYGHVQFPTDWPRQDDWRFVGGEIVVDLDCARETTRRRLREERAPLMADLDVQFMRALESGLSTAGIVAEKERLRAVTALVDGCETLAELNALSCVQAGNS